jgi:hypothetical protein
MASVMLSITSVLMVMAMAQLSTMTIFTTATASDLAMASAHVFTARNDLDTARGLVSAKL